MALTSAVGLVSCDKFEETPNKKVSDLSMLSEPYFKVAFYKWSAIVGKRVLSAILPFESR